MSWSTLCKKKLIITHHILSHRLICRCCVWVYDPWLLWSCLVQHYSPFFFFGVCRGNHFLWLILCSRQNFSIKNDNRKKAYAKISSRFFNVCVVELQTHVNYTLPHLHFSHTRSLSLSSSVFHQLFRAPAHSFCGCMPQSLLNPVCVHVF